MVEIRIIEELESEEQDKPSGFWEKMAIADKGFLKHTNAINDKVNRMGDDFNRRYGGFNDRFG
jgi:hypothetical protein